MVNIHSTYFIFSDLSIKFKCPATYTLIHSKCYLNVLPFSVSFFTCIVAVVSKTTPLTLLKTESTSYSGKYNNTQLNILYFSVSYMPALYPYFMLIFLVVPKTSPPIILPGKSTSFAGKYERKVVRTLEGFVDLR